MNRLSRVFALCAAAVATLSSHSSLPAREKRTKEGVVRLAGSTVRNEAFMNDRLKAVAIMSVSTDAGSTEIAIPLKLAKKAEPGGFVGWLCRMAPYLGRGAGDMRLANGVWRLDEKTRLPEHATLTTADRVQASTIDNLSSRGYLTGEYKKTGVKKIYAACWRAQNNLHL